MTPLGMRWQAVRRANDGLYPGVSQKSGAAARDAAHPAKWRAVLMDEVAKLAPVVGVRTACAALGVAPSSSYRQRHPAPSAPERPLRRPSPRALTADEQAQVRAHLNSARFLDRAPRTVYATLLDEGMRLCHWRTMYRLLRADSATRERRAIRRHPVYVRPELLATAPCQVWSWDITVRREVAFIIAPRVMSSMEPVIPLTVPWAAKRQGNAPLEEPADNVRSSSDDHRNREGPVVLPASGGYGLGCVVGSAYANAR